MISPELLSIIIGIAIFYFVVNLSKEERTLDSNTYKRLSNIKNKVYVSSQESEEDKKIMHNIKVLIQDTEYKVRLFGTILEKIKITAKIKRMLRIANVKYTVDVFLMLPAGLVLFAFLFILIITSKVSLALVLGCVSGSLPFLWIKTRIKKRLDLFTQQLPDALGLMSNSLRAGHSLQSSFLMVVQELPEPVCQVFKIVVDDISLGRDTREALENMTQVMPGSLDLRFFITAVLIQREIGGNLAEILDSLNYTIRERFKLIGQLNSQTAQARLSGIVLAVAPAIIGLIIWVMNPRYIEPLFKTTIGQSALVFAFASAFLGFMIIKKITTIRI